jgi:anti-sigma-K factor RskA
MIDERREELAALHALGLLEGPEREAFEAELARDAVLRRRVSELSEAACGLSCLARPAEPPAELRDRILGSIERRSPAEKPARILPFPSFLPWAIAACFAIVAAWTGQLYFVARQQNAVLDDQRRVADLELRGLRNQMEAERIVAQRQMADLSSQVADARKQADDSKAKLASYEQDTGTSRLQFTTLSAMPGDNSPKLAMAVWDPAMQQGMLEVAKLPPPPPGKDYQLWVVDPAYSKPVDGGVFQVDPVTCQACVSFRPNRLVRTPAKFAVSLERKGGVPVREGPIVMLGP